MKAHASMVKATETFLSLRKPGAGKVLFEMEHKEVIRQLMKDRIKAKTTTSDATKTPAKPNPGTEYQNALTELWDKVNQESFNVQAHTKDIFECVYPLVFIYALVDMYLKITGIKIISS